MNSFKTHVKIFVRLTTAHRLIVSTTIINRGINHGFILTGILYCSTNSAPTVKKRGSHSRECKSVWEFFTGSTSPPVDGQQAA